MYKKYIKRLLDLVLSSIGIVVLAIPMVIVGIILKLDSPGPVFFRQRRVGIHHKEFMILKFRSMPVTAPHDVATHQLDVHAVKLSHFQEAIRRYSIDELPQLFNIWLGQMSIVGPRPVLYNQYDLIELRESYGANDVKPGLTGWAQINGRDELENDEKAKLDGDYVQMLNKAGFRIDVKCFWLTIWNVIHHTGVVEGGTGELHKKEEAGVK